VRGPSDHITAKRVSSRVITSRRNG